MQDAESKTKTTKRRGDIFKRKEESGSAAGRHNKQDECLSRTSSNARPSSRVESCTTPVTSHDNIASASILALGEGHTDTSHQLEASGISLGVLQVEAGATCTYLARTLPVIEISPPIEDQRKISSDSSILDTSDPLSAGPQEEEVECHGRLWTQAYLKWASDKKSKSLAAGYEILLNGDLRKGDKGYKDPGQYELMTSLVKEKLRVMTRKQWTLPWGKTSFVVREQAEKIIKIVQQFSGIGTAVAGLDPTHAGVAWAGVCVLLPVRILFSLHFPSFLLILVMICTEHVFSEYFEANNSS
jgi:hypothetical protein